MHWSLVLLLCAPSLAHASSVTLWHSYRGAEQRALDEVLELWNQRHPASPVQAIAVPYEGLASKLTTAIPRGNGPDLFIFGHERIGSWAESGLLEPWTLSAERAEEFLAETLPPLEYEGELYGLPLAFKSLVMFYNKQLLAAAPRSTEELWRLAREHSNNFEYLLAYEGTHFYFHAPWFFGFGGQLFDQHGEMQFASAGAASSLAFAQRMQAEKVIPEEVTGALVAELFNTQRAAMVLSGPWFLGEIDSHIDFGVAPLPTVSDTQVPATPFLTDEAVFVSSWARDKQRARAVAAFLAGAEGARVRAVVGRQAVAHRDTWNDPEVANDTVLSAFLAQLPHTVVMDNRPRMNAIWEPAQLALKRALRRGDTPEAALKAAQRRYVALTRPQPPASSPWGFWFLALGLSATGLGLGARRFTLIVKGGQWRSMLHGWRWVGPAMTVTAVLICLPFAVGLVLALFSHHHGEWTFVGLANFKAILSSADYAFDEPLSFYYALFITVLWTASNVALHLALGLMLALLLNRQGLALRPLYRVLLVLPWAVPNYITALIWKQLFHKQYGALNALLQAVGLEPVAWFSSAGTAFFANLCTNVWLGFPFMMVVCLGALQAIPKTLYEAAEVDGAGLWQQFRHVTVPMLGPALLPAILLGTVWTFNQFNVVYLVSGGEPDNATDILISEAYRWAFDRQQQYGYAAAYAALIFVLLLGWSVVSTRAARRVEQGAA